MRPIGTAKELEERRKKAIGMLEQGLQPCEVARSLGVDRRSVRRWNAAFRRSGMDGLEMVPRHLEKREESVSKQAHNTPMS